MAEKNPDDRRRYLRYPPDLTETVMVQFSSSDGNFQPEMAALPIEESRGGLRLILLNREPVINVENDSSCTVEIASLGPQPAQVRWIEVVDEDVVKVGVELLTY